MLSNLALSAKQKSYIASANRGAVIARLAARFSPQCTSWLSATNPYNGGEPPRKFSDIGTAKKRDAIIELIAISGPNHCIDGWGFLARSLACLVAGDLHAARHFAYYAELRAALSILASEGVGIFNGLNCAIDQNGGLANLSNRANQPGSGTHAVAWLALQAWANGVQAAESIGTSIAIRNVTIKDALQSMWPGGATGGPIAQQLILTWGTDLERLADDRVARNVSSYTPHQLNPLKYSATETIEFVTGFWDCFEPTAGDPFLILDRYLFRLAAETQLKAAEGAVGEEKRIQSLSSRYGRLDPALHPVISEQFLTRKENPRDPIVVTLGQRTAGPAHPVEMISRGAILLRTATSIVSRLLSESGVTGPNQMEFWRHPFAEARGFWPDGQPPESLIDLWGDVEVSLLDLLQALKVPEGKQLSRSSWVSNSPNGLPRIFEADRIPVWSIVA